MHLPLVPDTPISNDVCQGSPNSKFLDVVSKKS
jgi:hypothetical protein